MNEKSTCRACGAEIPAGTPLGHCPKCLMGLALAAGESESDQAEAAAQRASRHFAGFKMVRQIGCGGMGVVYEALDLELNRTVALKLILDTQACSPVARRRFLIEAEAAARLDHPNIVPIYQVGEHEDQPFISMKLIKGESLRAKMSRGEIGLPLDGAGAPRSQFATKQQAIARLIADIARAVHHAHANNVIHRDLKPGNILIDGEGNPQLTDFGLAKILDNQPLNLTEPGMVQGTAPYMPPEQVRAEKTTAAADTYSLGAILYELLTGQPPFRGTTPYETMHLIQEQSASRPRTLNKHLARDLETICLKCLEKNPASRYSSTADLAEDLERWLGNQPIKARPAGVILRAGRWTKRNPLATALIASLVLALLAATGYFLESQAREREKHAALIDRWTLTTEKAWLDLSQPNMLFRAEDLASLGGRRPPDVEGAQRLCYAANISANPVVQAIAYAPLLEHLETHMRRSLGRPVIFDLRFCKTTPQSIRELADGQADFQRLAAVCYLRAKAFAPGVLAVVQEDRAKEAVIFVRSNSPITNLSQFIGRSFAFEHTNSTIHLQTKMELAEKGVFGTNLSFFHSFDETVLVSSAQGSGPRDLRGQESAKRVLAGEFDGAALQRPNFERLKHKKPGLREVASFRITPSVYVARAGLDAATIQAFQNAMLAIKDRDFINALPIVDGVTRFQRPDESDLERLRVALTNEVLQFEGKSAAGH